jgi:cobalt-zinc-cadmium efflux system membrane fusion protein
MNRLHIVEATLCVGLSLFLSGCGKVSAQQEAKAASTDTGPEPIKVQQDLDANNFKVDHPDQFPVVTAGEHLAAADDLSVTGVVNLDVSRQVPVPSLATGRIVEIDARLGDEVKAGQHLFKVRSSDIANAYSTYLQAVKNEQLTKVQLERAQVLVDRGAWPKMNLEIAQNAEDDNLVVLSTAKEALALLNVDPDHPTGFVDVFAPVSGTITDQEITNRAAIQSYALPAPFTISDLSHVWVICDVWENNMSQIHLGEYADIHLVAYPSRVLKARIGNVLPIIDPNIRTAKVRLEVDNPGIMRIGMFVTATFHGETMQRFATVPDTAILHLHDREWVYVPLGDGHFKRQEVVSGNTLPDKTQEVVSGLKPGDQVVARSLVMQNTVEQ